MVNVRDPILKPVPIAELRPTQITVGMREVMAKRKHWRREGKKNKQEVSKAIFLFVCTFEQFLSKLTHILPAIGLPETEDKPMSLRS